MSGLDLQALGGDALWWWLGVFSVITFVGSLILMPWLVLRMPADYFTTDHRQAVLAQRRASPGVVLWVMLRSLIGLLLLLAGIAMLVLPGQGVLTILVGLGLMEFPGKFALECRVARQPTVFSALNWIRRKGNRSPFDAPAV